MIMELLWEPEVLFSVEGFQPSANLKSVRFAGAFERGPAFSYLWCLLSLMTSLSTLQEAPLTWC